LKRLAGRIISTALPRSIHKVAELLGMNREAAYWLVRSGFMKAEPLMPK